MKHITKTRVVTRGFILDFVGSIQNTFGKRLTKYEEMVTKAQTEIWGELAEEKVKMKWYRYEITELTNGAVIVMLYGDSV